MISNCFEEEIVKIREKFAHVGFPYGHVNEVIKNFLGSSALFLRIYLGSQIPSHSWESGYFSCNKNENLSYVFKITLFFYWWLL